MLPEVGRLWAPSEAAGVRDKNERLAEKLAVEILGSTCGATVCLCAGFAARDPGDDEESVVTLLARPSDGSPGWAGASDDLASTK